MRRIVIIGSGITGMAAALLCAQQYKNAHILLLEAAPQPAPLLTGFRRKGLHFDTGFHCAGGLREGGILRLWLQALGVWEYIGDDKIYPLSEEYHFARQKNLKQDSSSHIYTFPSLMEDVLPFVERQFGAHAREQCAQLLAEIKGIWENSPYTNPHCRALPRLTWENSQSLTQKLSQYTFPPALRQMIHARCLLYGLTPEEATFHDYALVGGLYFDSCHGIDGGGKTLVRATLKALENSKIDLRCRAPVVRILHRGEYKSARADTDDRGGISEGASGGTDTAKEKCFHAIQLSTGEILEAEMCIFTGHPSQLPHMIDKGVFRPAFFQHIESMKETSCALTLYGESEHPYVNDRAVYLLPADHEAGIALPLGSEQPTAYVVGGRYTHGAASQGFPFVAVLPMFEKEFLHVQKPRPHEYVRRKAEMTQKAADYLRQRLPMLGRIHIHESATASTMQDWIYGGCGSLYGIAHTTSTMPLLPVTRMKNFFLAGQNILLPGILGGIVSAALAVGFATDHHCVLKGFRTCGHNAS